MPATYPSSTDSPDPTPLVTPDAPNFPPLGYSKSPGPGIPVMTCNAPSTVLRSPPPKPALMIQSVQPIRPSAILLVPEPQAELALSPPDWDDQDRNRVLNSSRSREVSANGRVRELSSGRTQAIGVVRKMLEEMRVSPAPSPSPTRSDFGRALSPAPQILLSVSAPAVVDRDRNGTWSPLDVYVPPAKQNQLQAVTTASAINLSPSDHGDARLSNSVPRVSITGDDESSSEDEPEDQDDAAKASKKKSIWVCIREAVGTVEKLVGPNWVSWSFWLRRKVNSANKRVWGHVNGSRLRPNSDDVSADELSEWDKEEAAIYCALIGSLDFNIIDPQVRACTTAKEVWDRLELLYREKPTPEACAASLTRELSQAAYFEGEDLERHLDRLVEINDELKCGPYPISFELAKHFVLNSLPNSILKHGAPLRTKSHLSIREVCDEILEIGIQVLGDRCKLLKDRPSGPTYAAERQVGASLPFDLRHYKYTGDGILSDGGLYTRSRRTCAACLARGHKAYGPDCPQTDARLGLWGYQKYAVRPNMERGRGGREASATRQTQEQGQGPALGGLSGRATPNNGANSRPYTNSEWRGRTSGRMTPGDVSRTPSVGRGGGDKVGIVSSKPSAFELNSWR